MMKYFSDPGITTTNGLDVITAFKQQPPTLFFNQANTDSDKINIGTATWCRTYGETYDMIFSDLLLHLQRPLKVLEIGSTHHVNGSGQVYCRMPYVSKYVGIDLEAQKAPFGNKGVFIQGNAYSNHIVTEAEQYAPYDIIIDDASHEVSDQIWFFQNYKRLAGRISIMVCEDVALNALTNMMARLQDHKIHAVVVPYYSNVYLEGAGHLLLRIDHGG